MRMILAVIFSAVFFFAAVGRAGEFLAGGDVSMVSRIEELGGVFREEGRAGDFFEISSGCGWNCYRVRLFVNPTGRNAVVQDVPYVIGLAKRIKGRGAKLILDFHYSDTWADPGKQTKPSAWAGLDFDGLEAKVEDYTSGVIAELRRSGVLPDIVQVGNEVTPGMLWPEGRIKREGDAEEHWEEFVRLLKAGISGVKAGAGDSDGVRIMIHIDCGGRRERTKWFFDNIIERGVEFDIIGQSYYPWWHGGMEALRANLRATAEAYGRDIMVVETAYPWREQRWWSGKENMSWPISKDGQRAFLAELVSAVRGVPGGRGLGVIYWYPESIPVKGLSVWNGGATALFDGEGEVLPGARALAVSGRE